MLPQCRKVFSIQISAITSFPPFIPCPFLLLLHLFLCLPCFFFFFFSRIFWIKIQIRDLFCNHHVVLSKWLVQFSSVTQSCLTLCDPMNGSTPGLPVHHQLPEFTQPHVHRVSDAIQPSLDPLLSSPLSSPSPPAPNPSQHQGLLKL